MNYSEKGYTLVEFLVVSIILVSVSSIIAGIVFSTLQSADRSTTSNKLSQSGNTALTVMSSVIRSSKSVTSIDGHEISDCVVDSSALNERRRGSLLIEEESFSFSGESIELLRGDGNVTTLACVDETIISDEAQLFTDDVRVVSGSCNFTCSQSTVFETPLINISFSLFELGDPDMQQDFNTSVFMRNFSY